jgi:hypothetical protein
MHSLAQKTYEIWSSFIQHPQTTKLQEILAEEVVFHSPVVWTPQVGKPITMLYLMAATEVLRTDFQYLRKIIDAESKKWVLEFQCKIEDVVVNGVDMIELNDEGKIIDFKVMIRPLKAINAIHTKMGEMLEKLKPSK